MNKITPEVGEWWNFCLPQTGGHLKKLWWGSKMWGNGHRIMLCNEHTCSERLKNCCHQNDTYTEKQCSPQERCLFSEAVSLASSRSPSKILASPKLRVGAMPPWWVWKLKDGVYCFWRNLRTRRHFLPPLSFWSAISVYLSAGFWFTLENTQIECYYTFVWNKHQMRYTVLSS